MPLRGVDGRAKVLPLLVGVDEEGTLERLKDTEREGETQVARLCPPEPDGVRTLSSREWPS